MSNIKLKPFQEKAIAKLREQFLDLWKSESRKIELIFKSPTGSGKTFMTSQYIEQLIEKLPEEDLCFLWISIGKGSLHVQAQEGKK